ncbi:MAG: DUF4199 domain-containing protein [Chitinophagales bacterium]
MQKVILKYGLIGGLVVSFLMVGTILFFLGHEDSPYGMIYGFAGMILAFSSIFFAVKTYSLENKGVSFGKALLIGLGITLIASTFYTATWLVYVNTAGKGFEEKYSAAVKIKMDKQREETIAKMQQDGKSAEEIANKEKEFTTEAEDNRKMMELYKNNFFVKAAFTYLEIVPVGIIMSLLIAIIYIFIGRSKTEAAL